MRSSQDKQRKRKGNVRPDRRGALKTLTHLLKEIRLEVKVSQATLGKRIGRDQTYVSRYESGERRLDILELRDVCAALGLTLERFCRRLNKLLSEEAEKGTTQKYAHHK